MTSGICGSIGLESGARDEAVLEGMVRRLKHHDEQVGRLRWRDIRFAAVSVQAPLVWPPPGYESPHEICAVLDGRIDNGDRLAAELAREGHPADGGDANVLAVGVRTHGPDFLKRIQGPVAAAIHDPQSETSWLIRDPLGIRPLYLHRSRSRILFASELRALMADSSVRVELDTEQLRVLLTLGFNPAPHTLLKGIHRMPPGHLVQVTNTGPKSIPYDLPADEEPIDLPFEEAVEGYRTLLQAVVRRSGSERTGILLSGGADSAA